ncbi:hypothetical protein BG846_05372 [Streptomyces fradiae ATCC 10745 = DSM 40063]|uniref:Uncharacterized protein n=1 Tax=Streptomyces fradiae ATCC 10745 = DSM 40063 TaxID=1319510 RepID=A0A1Y2NPK5_STRFR|nr:hypothetical protein BG846_05372 [Streptomyces fradiae ATCC 10745 = DSM 40063]
MNDTTVSVVRGLERMTTGLTKKPTRSSVCRWSRPAEATPRVTSLLPDAVASSSWVIAVSVMKSVAPRPRPSSFSASVSAGVSSKRCTAPRVVRTSGRGRSVGSARGRTSSSCRSQ